MYVICVRLIGAFSAAAWLAAPVAVKTGVIAKLLFADYITPSSAFRA